MNLGTCGCEQCGLRPYTGIADRTLYAEYCRYLVHEGETLVMRVEQILFTDRCQFRKHWLMDGRTT